jgi:SET domain-containing protein
MKNFEIRQAKNGSGIFSKKIFKNGEKLFEIKGKLIPCNKEDDLDERTRSNTIRFDEEMYISPEGEIGDFLNHSCEPNSGIIKKNNKLYLIAIKNIELSEEVVMDYSTIIADDDIWDMKCSCGEKECRKMVKKFSSLPKKIKEKYLDLGIVPDYIF